ncbi:CDP-alcohol phosphatidyltransferase family protein [bacterium]|nr:CDP-alcohol phosphatidyltransferase family protein [bacterium]MBU1884898.1 CDP-alcohol phosphatidyltransferase family protein [bacterium]
MTIYDLKPAFQNLLRPIVNTMAKKGITPNQVTWAAMILSLIVGGFIAITKGAVIALYIVPVFLFVRMALNAIDGMLAKEHDLKSDGGAVLNEMGDVISDAGLYLPLALIGGVDAMAVVLFVIIGIFTEMTGILGAVIKNDRRYDGPMGKSDRAFMIGALCLLWALGVHPALWSDLFIYAGGVLGAVTVANRWKGALS